MIADPYRSTGHRSTVSKPANKNQPHQARHLIGGGLFLFTRHKPTHHPLVIRWLSFFILTCLITACGKPAPAKHDPAPAAAVEQAAVEREPAARTKPGMDEAAQIASLIDPAKLATLGERRANPRIQKITAILVTAKAAGKNPDEIAKEAVTLIGWRGTPAGELTATAILRNLTIAERLGATTPEDIAKMRRGNAATVRRGPYANDILSVDHIIPRSIAPELDNVIANLELMPLRLNQAKGNKIGDRQRSLAKKLHAAGLLKTPELPE